MIHNRCRWCNPNNPIYIDYHDYEWGIPEYDDRKLFELLVLELFQAGLSWETILNKRENFRRAFDAFDPEIIQHYAEIKVHSLMQNSGIIRNRRKIEATICNAAAFLKIQAEWGSFSDYIWHFTGEKTVYEVDKTSSPLSDQIAGDLKKRGMIFIGTTIIYSYLQAIGVIYSHDWECDMYQEKPSGS